MKRTELGSLLVVLLTAVLPYQALGQSRDQTLEGAIQRTVDQTIDYFRTQQGAKFVGQYAADLTACKDGAWITYSKAYLDEFRDAVSHARVQAFTWTRRQVYVLAPDAALFAGEFKETVAFGPADKPSDFQGAWTILLKRIKGEWRIVHEHTSHVTPST